MAMFSIDPKLEYGGETCFLDSWFWDSSDRKMLDSIIREFWGEIDFKPNDKLRELILLKDSRIREEFAYTQNCYKTSHQTGGKYTFPNNTKMTPDEYNKFCKDREFYHLKK